LQNVTLTVLPGERVGVIGPNGAGKTSLFLTVCGVLKPQSGEIALFGKPVQNGKFHPEIGLVFQNPDDQLFSPSVWDDVTFGPTNMGLSQGDIEARAREALTTTGILALAERPPHHLSGGEKRMVSIAGVLAMRPRLVIYDEPGANLDMRSRRRLIRFLQAAEQTILIASHDLELILEVCDRVILLDEGQVVADGEPCEIMSDEGLMEAHGLEKPHSLYPHTDPHHGC
jgi:cobalt/nickel transport system ATP-binding protein